MRRMRWLLCALMVAGSCEGAAAGDFTLPFLRGSNAPDYPAANKWEGFYIGAQAGYTVAGADFSQATKSLIAFMLRNTTIENENPVSAWQVLGKGDTSVSHYGGFAGYQIQWDGAVVGVEVNYNHTNYTITATDAMRRTFTTSDGGNDVQVNGTASVRMTDYGTARVKLGWDAGAFLPYATVGVAIGHADVTRTATITGRDPADPTTVLYTLTSTDQKLGAFAYGYAAGLGVDWALAQNLFVRAEYEYIQFGWFNDINLHIHSARLGAALKF